MSHFASNRNPLFFIAEIGGNHEGDFGYAKELTRLALDSGADAVKFQVYSGDMLVSRIESPDRNKHFKRFELSREQYLELVRMCEDAGVMFMASVWDTQRLAWLEPHLSIHKVGSGDLTAYPLLTNLANTGKPMIVSTGLATLEEVRGCVEHISRVDQTYITDRKLALLQCTASYPCPDKDANLNAMILLAEEFGLPVGYSDHTLGTDAALAAATMGAEILEMHFTDSRENKEFRDHLVSITRDEARVLLEKMRKVKILQGERIKKPTPAEERAGHVQSFRRSVYAARDISAGETLSEENLTILRPAHGIPATNFDRLLGRTAARDLEEHALILEEDIR
jgi:N-acetylneuraminate synthase/N,N'-diacetyllegionaminate synthase